MKIISLFVFMILVTGGNLKSSTPVNTEVEFKINHNFPGGNVIVEKVDGDHITLRPDLRDTEGHWFYWYFEVNSAQGQTLTFEFKGGKSIGPRGPAISDNSGKNWHWLNESHLPEAEAFTYSFREDQSSVRFAFCIPYTLSDWNDFAKTLSEDFEQATLCETQEGRAVPMVTYGKDNKDNTLIAVVGRQHACEATPNFLIEGFIDEWANQKPEGLSLLVVPLMDLDGVENGDQGKNRIPHDHNRDYNETHIYPETLALRKYLEAWPGKLIVLDMHSPYIREGDAETVYLVGSSNPEMAAKQVTFSKLLEANARGLPYSPSNNVLFGEKWNHKGNLKKGKTLSSFCWTLDNCSFATTFEIPYANAEGVEINPDNLSQFGKSLLNTVIQYTTVQASVGIPN